MGKGEFGLVADDVQGQRDLETAMLRKLGYDAVSAPSGEGAPKYPLKVTGAQEKQLLYYQRSLEETVRLSCCTVYPAYSWITHLPS